MKTEIIVLYNVEKKKFINYELIYKNKRQFEHERKLLEKSNGSLSVKVRKHFPEGIEEIKKEIKENCINYNFIKCLQLMDKIKQYETF